MDASDKSVGPDDNLDVAQIDWPLPSGSLAPRSDEPDASSDWQALVEGMNHELPQDLFESFLVEFDPLPTDQDFDPERVSIDPQLQAWSLSAFDCPADSSASANPSDTSPSATAPPPKIGARFSSESVRILRNWFSNHGDNPFASDEDLQLLHGRTGLSKHQIAVWIGNTRRRGKHKKRPSSSRSKTASPNAMATIQRPGTPAVEMGTARMNPLERWVDSPSEDEPAMANAIARAIASTTPMTIDVTGSSRTDVGTTRTHLSYESSASSFGTPPSSNTSAYSHDSQDWTKLSKAPGRSSRRRKRRAPNRWVEPGTSLLVPRNMYQCTFCTETFKTKHNWQRHEMSLHLPLERWVCTPSGPREWDENRIASCVFCGEVEPDDAHMEQHNYSACQERPVEERKFTRKDHLKQHMRLVHNAEPVKLEKSLSEWKSMAPNIRSICGFCGVFISTWNQRVDHLSDHFKMGNTMADWKGDWGFDDDVLARLENSIPPYFIHTEQKTPFPFQASSVPSESPRNAFELIEVELVHFAQVHYDARRIQPNPDDLTLEACRIVFASEGLSHQDAQGSSWLRDLIMSSESIARQAKFGPMRSCIESRIPNLNIIGRKTLFEQCPLESQLQEFARDNSSLCSLKDEELQKEAQRLIQIVQRQSTPPSELISNWVTGLIQGSSNWLAGFKIRAQIAEPSRHESTLEPHDLSGAFSSDPGRIEKIMSNYHELERRLKEYVDLLSVHRITPNERRIQSEAQNIVAEFDDEEWKRVALRNGTWIAAFKRRNMENAQNVAQSTEASLTSAATLQSEMSAVRLSDASGDGCNSEVFSNGISEQSISVKRTPETVKNNLLYTQSANFQRWVALELARWAKATMSPNNPNQHTPTDEELQHQARWILYEDGDPWNLTPADNAEWLRRFKMDVGIEMP